jgi:TolA-binding protein
MISSFMSLEKRSAGPDPKRSDDAATDKAAAQREADIYDLIAWFEVNKGKVALTAIVLVAIGFGVATVRYMKEQKELKASTELLALKPTVSTPTNQTPPQASAFAKVAQDFPGTAAGERAELFAASTLFTENKFAEAHTAFSKFLADHPGSQWRATAAYGMAAALEAQGKSNEALAAYQSVTTGYPNAAVADDARLAMARMYETQKQPEQALRLYNELLPQGAMVPGRNEAYMRREALYKEFPHLNTNRPLVTAPAPTMIPTGTNAPTLRIPGTNAPAATNAAAPVPPPK